ncbi:MAG: PFL family protein [Desulfobulbus propionicus]|nr:MAG: PFL family protein [Desulfobulbus propionicus]
MIRSDQILNTVDMVQKENLDVRAVTMGIDLTDCRSSSATTTCTRIHDKICRYAAKLVDVCDRMSRKYGIPVVNKRIAVTPVALIAAGFHPAEYVDLAKTLDKAAAEVGVDFLGGFSANVENGTSSASSTLMETMPEAMSSTGKVCASVNVASTRYGVNMDAVAVMGDVIKSLAESSGDTGGFAAAKLVIFANQPEANPFMAGAIHGPGQPEMVINVGVSGPGVIARALERKLEMDRERPGLQDLADEIKQTAFRVTRCGELIGRRVAQALGISFGIVDVSLAPTPRVGDSVGEILRIMGVDDIGAPGSTAIIALLNDAVKKGGTFASQSAGGLSGAFIPVCEDKALADAVRDNTLPLEKLEAMTSVCSVGLDMIAIPGSVDAKTISAIIADEMAIGMINNKTTAVRIIPVPGREAGDVVSFGGLFGESAIMPVRNIGKSNRFIDFGGKIPAPLHSLKN